jgi:hypothetical protein
MLSMQNIFCKRGTDRPAGESQLLIVSFVVRSAFRVLLLLLGIVSTANAADRKVLVVSSGKVFEEAMRVSLSAWSLSIQRLEGATPPGTMPRAAEQARALAQEHQAVGVVWITTEVGGHALWAYDADTQQVVTRTIASAPPYDAPTAAAAALTVKTLLRSSTVAPPEERIGAEVAQEMPKFRPPPAEALPEQVREPTERLIAGEIGLGARFLSEGTDLRFAGGIALRPLLGTESARRLAFVLEGRSGPGLSIDTSRFVGHFSDVTVPLWVRYAIPSDPA